MLRTLAVMFFGAGFLGCASVGPVSVTDDSATPETDSVITIRTQTSSSTPGSWHDWEEWTFHPNGDCTYSHGFYVVADHSSEKTTPAVFRWHSAVDYWRCKGLVGRWGLMSAKIHPSELIPGSETMSVRVKIGERENDMSYHTWSVPPIRLWRLLTFLKGMRNDGAK